ncbi:MAG: polynucleotide adenylyltransferase, partial [Clostridia bacterium]|nr:polynucleotide adenylyltransferase [Clostridia bacterium]
MNVKISEKATLIIDTLRNAGFEAFAVGGAVRDNLMGREADDFDITTSAKPEETKKVFSSF